MKLVIFSCTLLLLSTAFANESRNQREQQSEDRGDTDDVAAYESFNSPVYGSTKGAPAPVKGYPLPVAPALPAGYALPAAPALPASPVLPAGYGLPAAYTTYLNSLGSYAASPYAYGNAYSRYSLMPYSAPYYGNGAPYAAPYAGYGYPAGPGYGNLLGRSAAAYNAYPGYAGYRFGGPGYNAGALRGPAVPVAPVAAGVAAYAAPAVPVQSKGSALPYGYAPPAALKLPVY